MNATARETFKPGQQAKSAPQWVAIRSVRRRWNGSIARGNMTVDCPLGTQSLLLGRVVVVLLSLFLVSCVGTNSDLITSLEDLTSETERQGTWEIEQNRIISINGLLPHSAAASTYYYKSSRSPSTAIGVSYKKSFLSESRIDGPSIPELLKIRTKVLDARAAAAEALDRRLELAAARARLAACQGEPSAAQAACDENQKEVAAATTAYGEARGVFSVKLQDAVESVAVPGVLVVRWQTNDHSSNSSLFGSLFGSSNEEDLATSGFAILGGLRLTTLFVGRDVLDFKPGVERSWDWWSASFPWIGSFDYEDVRLTTHLFQVRNILYIQDADIEEKAQVALKASYSELANLGATIRELDRIEVESILTRLSNLSNLGVVGSVKRRVYPVTYVCDASKSKEKDLEESALRAVTIHITGRTPEQQASEVIADTKRDQIAQVQGSTETHADAPRILDGAGINDSTVPQPQDYWHTIYVVDQDLSDLQDLFDDSKLKVLKWLFE